MRILIADDDPVTRRLLGSILTQRGYDVIAAADGDEAWAVLDGPDCPTLAILDWQMPGRDGIDLCRLLRARKDRPYVFVLLLTSRTQKADVLVGLESGADDYIMKPFDAVELDIRLRVGRRIVASLEAESAALREVKRLRASELAQHRAADQAKSDFVSVVSHELRTPLTSVRGALGLLAGGAAGEIPPAFRPLLEISLKNIERLVRLINDLLDMQRIESGKLELVSTPQRLLPLVDQAVAGMRDYARSFRVEIGVDVEAGAREALAYVDGDRLVQVLANLISNGAKFSPPGGTVRVSLSRAARGLRVSVRDDGPGIPESFRGRIFGKFSQADGLDPREAREKKGSGLGLSITRALVEGMNGVIGYESEVGRGATFHVDFPAVPEARS
jgi:signal transduction histidine kinase